MADDSLTVSFRNCTSVQPAAAASEMQVTRNQAYFMGFTVVESRGLNLSPLEAALGFAVVEH